MRPRFLTLLAVLLVGSLQPMGAEMADAQPAGSAAQIEYLIGVAGMT